jgi:hypothetical protein
MEEFALLKDQNRYHQNSGKTKKWTLEHYAELRRKYADMRVAIHLTKRVKKNTNSIGKDNESCGTYRN